MGNLKACFVNNETKTWGRINNIMVKIPWGGVTVREKITDIRRLIFM